MKKQIITVALSVLLAAAVFVPVFLFVQMVVRDHRNINSVTAYLNQVIEAANKAAQAQTPAVK